MRARCFSLALVLSLALLPAELAQAGRGRALGSIVQSNNSTIDNEDAMAGADVYACDVLSTDGYGNARVQFGRSQIVLAPTSEVVLDGHPDAVRVIVISGIVTFSAPSSGLLEIDTPAGVLRESAGQAFSGAVNLTGPKTLLLSSYRGDLLLNNAGQLHTVPAGQSARVTFDTSSDASCRNGGYIRQPSNIGFYVIGGGIAAVGGYAIWQELTESETKPGR